MPNESLEEFVKYYQTLKGYEKGEAQPFLEHLFKAFGYEGAHEAGASYEAQLKGEKSTKFRDLLWPGKVLVEMKSRGEDLGNHVHQAREYWNNSFDAEKTEYVILCNFDEFWIYNWYHQDPPLDKVKTIDLPQRWRSLAFFSKEKINPQFQNDVVAVTKDASNAVLKVYRSLLKREIERETAQRFILQCLICLFAEDTGLFPINGFFLDLINDCKNGQSTFDLFTLLFQNMNSKDISSGGKFKDIDYFNGGIFHIIDPIELNPEELNDLEIAANHDWSKVEPSIFGNIFEFSMDEYEQHETGAHYTYEKDIMLIIRPTIIEPWIDKINNAKTLKQLLDLHEEMSKIKILDPACGSGNFLYIAYRELKKLELELFRKIVRDYKSIEREFLHSNISCKQFFGIDINNFAVELAKVTLSFGKKFATDAFNEFLNSEQLGLGFEEQPLPFDDLDNNILCEDALFNDWPEADFIIGNPPYQSKNKMQEEFGREYLNRLREQYPEIPGLADYCVYWFHKAHNHLKNNGRAGLVGTNTIRQTNSRKGSLGYILENNGTIIDAVSTMPWSGKAVVHVSIVNWFKASNTKINKCILRFQRGEKPDNKWELFNLKYINSSLSVNVDVSKAFNLKINKNDKTCFQGQTHGHEGFLLSKKEYEAIIQKDKTYQDVIFPYLIADELIGSKSIDIKRYVIDFSDKDILSAQKYKIPFNIVKEKVLPDREKALDLENKRNKEASEKNPNAKTNKHHYNFHKTWWQLSYSRIEMMNGIAGLSRFISCGQVTKRPIFEFISSNIHPNAALMVFTFEDDYSFGILQSTLHWEWFKSRCSTLKSDYRYTSTTVYDSFPWPQWGSISNNDIDIKKANSIIKKVATKSKDLRDYRNMLRKENNFSLREMYRSLELPGQNPLRDLQEQLDSAVWEAYHFGLAKELKSNDELEFLLNLNLKCHEAEEENVKIYGPGLPEFIEDKSSFISDDCVNI